MGVYNIIAPVSPHTSPYNYLTDANSKTAWTLWGSHIKNAAKLANVPANIIYAFMMVESKGIKASADKNPSTPGLMQWNPHYAFEVIEKEKNNGRMSIAEEEFLATKGIKFVKVGTKYQISGTPITQVGIERRIAKATTIDPWLNIYIGAMYLGQYMDESWGKDTNGTVRMDRIVARYNGGQGAFKSRSIGTKTTDAILADPSLPVITKNYIKQVIGTNGTLHTGLSLDLPKTV